MSPWLSVALDTAQTAAIWIVIAWMFAHGEVKKELWWFAHYFGLPVTILFDIHDAWVRSGWSRVAFIFFSAMYLLVWWISRHDGDDDDRWKKRRKKARAKVQQVGGKLVVVPLPAPVRN